MMPWPLVIAAGKAATGLQSKTLLFISQATVRLVSNSQNNDGTNPDLGTYLVSSPIVAYYGTQMIGNPTSRPIIKAAPSFLGLGVISTDIYTGGGKGIDKLDQEWYINTVGNRTPLKKIKPNPVPRQTFIAR